MSTTTNIGDITLQSTDGTLVARNDFGNLVYPMLFLDREPVPSDAQDWDRVLVFIDDDGTINVSQTVIYLTEENNHYQSIYLLGDGSWSISDVDEDFIALESSTGQMLGVGSASIGVQKASMLTTQGAYTTYFTVTNSKGEAIRIQVYITVNMPLTVNGVGNNGTLAITLNANNDYTRNLTIIRDREWTLESVVSSRITVTPTSGNGADLPDFASMLTVTKSPSLTNTTTSQRTETSTFYVVSLFQRVRVDVTIVLPPIVLTIGFIDPLPGEIGAPATGTLYLYA